MIASIRTTSNAEDNTFHSFITKDDLERKNYLHNHFPGLPLHSHKPATRGRFGLRGQGPSTQPITQPTNPIPLYLFINFNLTSPAGANVIGLPALLNLSNRSTSSALTPAPSLIRCPLNTCAKNATNSACANLFPRQARGPSEKVRKVPRMWRGVNGSCWSGGGWDGIGGDGGTHIFGVGCSQRDGARRWGLGQYLGL